MTEQTPKNPFPSEFFNDCLKANGEFAAGFQGSALTGSAAKGLAIVTCMDSRMAQSEEADIHATINQQFGVDTRSIEFRTVADQKAALATDLTRIRTYPLLRTGVHVGGAIYNVGTGVLEPFNG
ncbi:MAG: hypothetical protein NT115_02030 [Proteobacteria bacterium]|nr:hypothetical protein [Pseudomonadota bacterium]